MLPNIDDDTSRCSPSVNLCNDATDEVVNGGSDADDLARLRTVPIPGAPAGSRATVRTTGAGSDLARVFLARGGAWIKINPGTELTTAEVRGGVELGIEGTDIIRDAAIWDGRVTVRLTVDQAGETTTDEVVLRVAPVLTHSPVQPVEQVLVTNGDAGPQEQFVTDLGRLVEAAGIEPPLITFPESDIWTQDFFEPAYTSMIGSDGTPQVLRVMIRSHQPRTAGHQVFSVLRGPDVGAIELADVPGWETLNSMGNLETIPPYQHRGNAFPAGRIIQGERGAGGTEPSAAMRTMLRSQGLQRPMLLDTSWLYVGHVDEFVQFLPADTERGWKIAISDPAGGLALLRDAASHGHGSTRLFSLPGGPSTTIAQALANPTFVADNELAIDRITANLRELKRKTGVKRAEVIKVPGLYSSNPSGLLERIGAVTPRNLELAGQQLGRALGGGAQTAAEIPGAINGIVISPDVYIAPKQWGPVIDGEDVFTAAVNAAYAEVGMEVVYLDDWYSHHIGLGEVHCGTNTYRAASAQWWPSG